MSALVQLARSKQVAAQYRAVAHLAQALARVHSDIAQIFEEGHSLDLVEMCGGRSAYIMETLGNILNNMDAVDDDEDAWLEPIFEIAHLMFPLTKTDGNQP